MSDEEPLELAPMLPALMASDLSPTGGSVNVLDMISQDVMLGNSFQSTSNASTEVTYTSQYTSPSATPFSSAAPFTSAGDVFLPSIPITTAANTFVKPLHTYIPPTSQNERNIFKPNPRHPFRPKYQSPEQPSPFTYNPVPQEKSILRTPFTETIRSESEKSRKSSKKSSFSIKKKSKSRSHSSHKSSSRSKSLKKSSSSRSKAQLSSSLLRSPERSAFTAAMTRSGTLRSAAVTHTVARTVNTFTESVTLATDTVTYTTTTVAHTVDQHASANAWSSLKTTTVKSCIATGTQSPVSGEKGTYNTIARSNLTTSSTTSYTVTRPRTPATIISPMQSTYLSSRTLHSSLPVISRATPAVAGARHAIPSTTSEKSREKFTMLTTQTALAASAIAPDRASTEIDAPTRSQTRLVIPVNTYASSAGSIVTTTPTTKHCVAHTTRSTPTTNFSTNMQTYAVSKPTDTTTAACPRTLAQSTITLPPGATLYTARKIPAARATRSRTAVTTESQTITIVNEKGAYTTLTISSDFTATTGGPLVVTQTHSPTAVTAGVGSQMTSITTDTVIRPRSQLLIPIANSQMNTSTSLGYLVTSPIGSDIISSHNSTAATSTQSASTTATALGTHTITTISSEALNKIRSRLIYNVPSTVAGMGVLPPSTSASDSNRTRGPVTIIANQLISAVTPRDGSRPSGTAASHTTAVTRTLFSAATTQDLYALTTPITVAACSSPTTLLDHTGRPVNRVVIPIMSNVHASPNTQSSASTQGTYIFTTGVRPTTTTGDFTRPSRVSGLSANTTTTTLTSMTVASASTRTFPGADGGCAYTSSIGTTDVHSKLRNRLTVKVTTAESSMPRTTTPVTAYAIRNRTPQSIYAYSTTTAAYSTSTKTDSTRSPATMTLLTFAQSTSGGNPRASSPRRLLTATTTTTSSSVTTVTPTLTNTGNHYVIKLGPSGPAASSVTAAVTSPLTTAALSSDHTFLEPHPVPSRLRTFPAPRTYPVAQRLAGNQQRPPVARNVSQRPKKVVANPAPLQIFADVVCPPTTAQTHTTTTATQGHPKAHFTLSHCSGSSTLVVPQYKNTVFKNLSTIAHPSHERSSSRFLAPQAASDRLILNRSVALVSSRRLSPVAHTAVQDSLSATRPSRSERATTAAARSQATGDSTPFGDDHDEQCD